MEEESILEPLDTTIEEDVVGVMSGDEEDFEANKNGAGEFSKN